MSNKNEIAKDEKSLLEKIKSQYVLKNIVGYLKPEVSRNITKNSRSLLEIYIPLRKNKHLLDLLNHFECGGPYLNNVYSALVMCANWLVKSVCKGADEWHFEITEPVVYLLLAEMLGKIYFDKYEFFNENNFKTDNQYTNEIEINVTSKKVERVISETMYYEVECVEVIEGYGTELKECVYDIFSFHDTCTKKMEEGTIFMPIGEVMKYISDKFGQEPEYNDFRDILYSVFIRVICLKSNRINSFGRDKDFKQYLISKFEIG